ncbi:MAG TPA: hypothetical protein VFS41_12700 [Edaphobacter sp.]|nr:hypothetical protein [Edaphobacter sp.]
MNPYQCIEEFLRKYEYNCTLNDGTALVAQFSDPFQIATPEGTKMVDRKTFAAGISRRRQLMKQMGCGEAQMISIATTLLDQRYALARTQWQFSTRDEGKRICTESTFLIEDVTGEPKIVLYLSHDDLQGKLSERG